MMRYLTPSRVTKTRIGCFAPNQISVSDAVGFSDGDHIEKNGSHETTGTLGGRNAADAESAMDKTAVAEIQNRFFFILSP
jgi:hypothetical protein